MRCSTVSEPLFDLVYFLAYIALLPSTTARRNASLPLGVSSTFQGREVTLFEDDWHWAESAQDRPTRLERRGFHDAAEVSLEIINDLTDQSISP